MLRIAIVYDSEFGNTEQVARVIAETLDDRGEIVCGRVGQSNVATLSGFDLIILGCPTQRHHESAGAAAYLESLPCSELWGKPVAVFDTRYATNRFLSGSAAHALAKDLRRKGARVTVPPESFFVEGREGPLAAGERERAEAWALDVAAQVVKVLV